MSSPTVILEMEVFVFCVSYKALEKVFKVTDEFRYSRPDGLLVIIKKDDVWNFAVTVSIPQRDAFRGLYTLGGNTYWGSLERALDYINYNMRYYEDYKKST